MVGGHQLVAHTPTTTTLPSAALCLTAAPFRDPGGSAAHGDAAEEAGTGLPQGAGGAWLQGGLWEYGFLRGEGHG